MNQSGFVLVSLIILMVAGSAFAQEADLLGLYFDPLGGTNCLDSSFVQPFSQFELYLVLKNPSFAELLGFEAGLHLVGNSIILQTIIPGGPNIIPIVPENIIVEFVGGPMIMEDINVLATFTVLYTSIGEEVCFELHGSQPSSLDSGLPALLTGDEEIIPAQVNYWNNGDCSALISEGPCVVATAVHTWDSLKTLYR